MEKLELSFYKLHFSIFGRKKKKIKKTQKREKKIDEFNFKKKCSYFFQIQKLKRVNKIIDTFFCLRKKYDYKNYHDILPKQYIA